MNSVDDVLKNKNKLIREYFLEEMKEKEIDDIDISYVILRKTDIEAVIDNQVLLLTEITDFKYEGHKATVIYEIDRMKSKMDFDLLDEEVASKIKIFIDEVKKCKQKAFLRYFFSVESLKSKK